MLFSIEAMARRMNVSERTARIFLRQVPSVMVGKRRRWRMDVVDQALRDAAVPPQLAKPAVKTEQVQVNA